MSAHRAQSLQLAVDLMAATTITTAVSASTTTPLTALAAMETVTLEAIFTYGSGGTSTDAWVQTSLDQGATWIDICNVHYTTSSAKTVYNLSSLTPVTTAYTPTDGTLSANTSKDGILGDRLRVKYTTVGTYAGGTTLQIAVVVKS